MTEESDLDHELDGRRLEDARAGQHLEPRRSAEVRPGWDLEFRGVGASLGGRQILRDVSGAVRRGEMLAVLGSSGR